MVKIKIYSQDVSNNLRTCVEIVGEGRCSGRFVVRVFLLGLHVVNSDPAFVPEEERRYFSRTGDGELAGEQVLQVAMARLKNKRTVF